MEAILAIKTFIVLAIRSKPLIKQSILSVFHRIDAIRNGDILGVITRVTRSLEKNGPIFKSSQSICRAKK
jgi:hypothetical protein